MKLLPLLGGLFGLVLASCSSLMPLPDAVLQARAQRYLDGASHVDPLQATIDPDFINERKTLVRIEISDGNGRTMEAPDLPLGISFGNGLYLDSAGNLSIRLDRMAGITPDWTGTTAYSFVVRGAEVAWTKTVKYSKMGLEVSNPSSLVDRSYVVNAGDKKISVALTPLNGFVVEFLDQGKVKVYPQLSINPFAGYTYETTPQGVKESWWDSTLGIPLPKSDTYSVEKGRLVDSDKTILVEDHGTYMRFAFTKGNLYSYRIYRTPSTFLMVDESSGKPVFLAKKVAQGWAWKDDLIGGLGNITDIAVDCGIKLTPGR